MMDEFSFQWVVIGAVSVRVTPRRDKNEHSSDCVNAGGFCGAGHLEAFHALLLH